MAINDSTLDTDVWTTIRTILVAAALTTTNSSTSATTAATIDGVYNDKKSLHKPQVIINPIDIAENSFKFGGKYGMSDINVTIECYAETTRFTDQLAQQVKETIRDAMDGNTIPGIDLIAISSDQAFVDPNQAKYQIKGLTFTFRRE